MALIEINFNPTQKELRTFGFIMLLFFGFVGGVVLWASGLMNVAVIIWIVGLVFCSVYYLLHALQLPLYKGWMRLVYPIGWVLSHLLFGFIYYIIMTPIGLLLRLVGHDPLHRRTENTTSSFWKQRATETNMERYFKQF